MSTVITMDHPPDPTYNLIKLTKKANKTEANTGDIVTYTITIESKTTTDLKNVYITDKIPPGFKYIKDRAILDDRKTDNPQGQRPVTFNIGTLKAGEPVTKLLIFYSQAKQKAAHNEFPGTGGSLYYLKHRPVIEGSDKVAVEIRDKNTGLVIAKVEQAEGDDYEIDYTNGRIMFYEPVSQTAQSNSIISTSILDGNPLYVVVDYEYEVTDLIYDDSSYGGRVEQSLIGLINGERTTVNEYRGWIKDIRVGGTYIKDSDNTGYELKGTDLTAYIGKYSKVRGEYAWSKQQGADAFFSTDGGLSFDSMDNYSLTGTTQGKALSINAETYLFDKLDIKAYHKRVDRGFSSASTLSEQGKQVTGGAAALEITPETHLDLSYDTQKLIDGGNASTALQTGAQSTDTTTARITHDMDKLKITGEYRHIM